MESEVRVRVRRRWAWATTVLVLVSLAATVVAITSRVEADRARVVRRRVLVAVTDAQNVLHEILGSYVPGQPGPPGAAWSAELRSVDDRIRHHRPEIGDEAVDAVRRAVDTALSPVVGRPAGRAGAGGGAELDGGPVDELPLMVRDAVSAELALDGFRRVGDAPLDRRVEAARQRQSEATFVAASAATLAAISLATGLVGRTRERLRRQLAQSEARFRALAENSPDVVMRVRLDPFRFEYVSPSVEGLTGTPPEAFLADPMTIRRHLRPEDVEAAVGTITARAAREHVELRFTHVDGTERTLDIRTQPLVEDGKVVAIDATARDVTEAVGLREQLDVLAHHDVLTGLMNRRALLAALENRIRAGTPTAVLFADLDGFKEVNDRLGHDVGDQVLVVAARRLAAGLRGGDLVARFAGDEFVVVVDPSQAERLADRMVERLGDPILLSGTTVSIGASVGVAHLSAADTVDDVLRRADEGMYVAKRRGRGQVVRT